MPASGETVSRSLQRLTPRDREVVGQCLNAVVHAPWFEEPEFFTLFGASRSEVSEVLMRWPDGPWRDPLVLDLAVNNSLLHVLSYPHGASEAEWRSYITASPAEINQALGRWRGEPDGGIGTTFFKRLA